MEFVERKHSIIKVIGVGGGGSNAVAYMYNQGIVGVDFAVCNTDSQALEASPVDVKIHLGPNLTEGMGAGSVPEVGKQSCIESIDEVRQFLDTGTKMLFITAGMGGGTGTGAAPIIAKAAKEQGVLTVAIVTLPFKFEGNRRREQALQGLEDLKKCVDSVLVISNDRLRAMHGDLTLKNAFGKADNVLTTAARGIAEIITVPGYINVDFKDVNTVMKNSGVSIMGYAEASGESRAKEAVQTVLNSPLLEDNDIRGAQHILLNISSGANEVTMDEIGEITEYIQEEAGNDTHLIWGNCNDDSLGDKLSITIIATGFDDTARRVEKKNKEAIKVHLDDDMMNKTEAASMPQAEVFDVSETSNVIEFESPVNEPFVAPATPRESTPPIRNARPAPMRRQEVRQAEMVDQRKETSIPLDNPRIIAEMEEVPAYLRRKVSLEDVQEKQESETSKLSINFDENENPIIERNNSFFHDNVD